MEDEKKPLMKPLFFYSASESTQTHLKFCIIIGGPCILSTFWVMIEEKQCDSPVDLWLLVNSGIFSVMILVFLLSKCFSSSFLMISVFLHFLLMIWDVIGGIMMIETKTCFTDYFNGWILCAVFIVLGAFLQLISVGNLVIIYLLSMSSVLNFKQRVKKIGNYS